MGSVVWQSHAAPPAGQGGHRAQAAQGRQWQDVAAAAAERVACHAGVLCHVSVREVLLVLRDAASQRYVQRRHVRTASTGFATAASACVECDAEGDALPSSMKEGREEGGEPPQ